MTTIANRKLSAPNSANARETTAMVLARLGYRHHLISVSLGVWLQEGS
jgi:hypothetical protein